MKFKPMLLGALLLGAFAVALAQDAPEPTPADDPAPTSQPTMDDGAPAQTPPADAPAPHSPNDGHNHDGHNHDGHNHGQAAPAPNPAAPAGTQLDEQSKAVVERMKNAYKALGKVQFDSTTTQTQKSGDMNITFSGSTKMLFDSSNKKFRGEFRQSSGNLKQNVNVVSNGKTIWAYEPDAKQYATGAVPTQEPLGAALIPLGVFTNDLNAQLLFGLMSVDDFITSINANVKYAGKETRNGQEVEVLLVDTPPAAPPQVKFNKFAIRILVGANDSLLRGVEVDADLAQGDQTMTSVFNYTATVNTAPTFAANAFEWTAPSGAKKVQALGQPAAAEPARPANKPAVNKNTPAKKPAPAKKNTAPAKKQTAPKKAPAKK